MVACMRVGGVRERESTVKQYRRSGGKGRQKQLLNRWRGEAQAVAGSPAAAASSAAPRLAQALLQR